MDGAALDPPRQHRSAQTASGGAVRTPATESTSTKGALCWRLGDCRNAAPTINPWFRVVAGWTRSARRRLMHRLIGAAHQEGHLNGEPLPCDPALTAVATFVSSSISTGYAAPPRVSAHPTGSTVRMVAVSEVATTAEATGAVGAMEAHPDSDQPPRWERPAFIGLLAGTALLYLWGLDRADWANSNYSAASFAGSRSWKAWFFGASDPAGSITVDKPPAPLWITGLSVRMFGLNR